MEDSKDLVTIIVTTSMAMDCLALEEFRLCKLCDS